MEQIKTEQMKTEQETSANEPSNVLSESISQFAFRQRCEAADRLINFGSADDVCFFYDHVFPSDVLSRFGRLHVTRTDGLRAVFDVGCGQSYAGAEQNRRTRIVLDALGLPITNRVLVDEDEDKDSRCPACGRGYR